MTWRCHHQSPAKWTWSECTLAIDETPSENYVARPTAHRGGRLRRLRLLPRPCAPRDAVAAARCRAKVLQGSDLQLLTFDPKIEGLCSLTGGAISAPRTRPGFVVRKLGSALKASSAAYYCAVLDAGFAKAVEFHVDVTNGGIYA